VATGDAGCQNLACYQVTCPSGGTTTLSGHVYAPNGQLPLYNAFVYVPNGTPAPITDGASCDVCSPVTGNPLNGAIALTDSAGAFTLKNVPAGVSFPVVYQLGKWRRSVTISAVTACTDTALTDVNQQRLAKNSGEGSIPKMAFATGNADEMECLLAKIGVDPSEYGYGGQGKRIELYVNNGFNAINDGGASVTLPSASSLYGTDAGLGQYDVVVMDCAGTQSWPAQTSVDNLVEYTNAGGRLFATHYEYTWLNDKGGTITNPFSQVAIWNLGHIGPGGTFTSTWQASVDLTLPNPDGGTTALPFPKGEAFYQWLGNVNGLTGTAAQVDAGTGTVLIMPDRYDVTSVVPQFATEWFYGTQTYVAPSSNRVGHMTFNTPVGSAPYADGGTSQCGRVVYSDFHVNPAGGTGTVCGGGTCTFDPATTCAGQLTADAGSAAEKALAFMLFDVSSCIQSDSQQQTTCPTVGQACSSSNPCCSGLPCVDGGSGDVCIVPT
jgi:hypothetical protein